MDSKTQLDEWVKGNPIHNHDKSNGGECCPDFSCCQPELLAPLATRIAFRDANEEDRFKMLGLFLSAGLAAVPDAPKSMVYISGDWQQSS